MAAIAKKIVIGGVSGIILGASSMSTAGNAIIEDVAADVNDSAEDYESLSFGEAYAAAREDLGPGETFEWHGNTYSTSTAEEWNAAHPSESLTEDATGEIYAEEDLSGEDEVEILGAEEDNEDGIEVEIETGSDINGDEAAFVDLEEDMQTDAMEDVYVGQDADYVSDTSDYSNDDAPIV